ncbi:MAG: AAA family ATPase, partial [Planctomycetota bacterium]
MDDIEQFKQLINSGYCCISILTHEERYALEIVRQAVLDLNSKILIWSVAGGVREGLMTDSPSIAGTETPAAGLSRLAEAKAGSICVTLDLAEHLRGGQVLRVLREMIDRFEENGNTLVLIDCTDKLPEVVRSHARPFEISFPDEKELQDIIRKTLSRFHRKTPIEVGITQKGLNTIVRNLRGLTRRQAERIIVDTVAQDRCFADDDINVVIASKRRMIQRGGLLEYVRTPLDLSEIGGMKHLKEWLAKRRDAFSSKAEDFGLRAARGVLMLGVQGAGKSLCAKAIATAWHQPLLRMDPGALYASFVGESERNLRDALRQTEAMAPVVLWIDEIEKGFASAASQSTDGGLSKRMFGS